MQRFGFLSKHLKLILMQDVGGSPLTGRERVEGRDQVKEEEVAEAGEDGYEVVCKLSWGFKFYPKSSEE